MKRKIIGISTIYLSSTGLVMIPLTLNLHDGSTAPTYRESTLMEQNHSLGAGESISQPTNYTVRLRQYTSSAFFLITISSPTSRPTALLTFIYSDFSLQVMDSAKQLEMSNPSCKQILIHDPYTTT